MTRTRNTTPLESVEQFGIRKLMLTLGATEYVLGTKRKRGDHPGTMQTPGLPDLQFFLPEKREFRRCEGFTRRLVIVEAKRAKVGRYSPAQLEYRDLCRAAGVDWIGGALNDVIAWLITEGYLRANQVSHEHLTSTPGPRCAQGEQP